jgi:hypothetical protein
VAPGQHPVVDHHLAVPFEASPEPVSTMGGGRVTGPVGVTTRSRLPPIVSSRVPVASGPAGPASSAASQASASASNWSLPLAS